MGERRADNEGKVYWRQVERGSDDREEWNLERVHYG